MTSKEIYELVKDVLDQITDQVKESNQPLEDSAYLLLGKYNDQMIVLATGSPIELSRMLVDASRNNHMKKAVLIAALAIMHGDQGFDGEPVSKTELEF